MKLWKYSGTLLTATGIIHTIYALFLGKEAFTEMLNNGLIDSIGENHNLGFAFWFLICGIILILWGETLQYYIRKEQKPAPLFLGYFILLFTIIGLHSRTNIRFLAFLTASTYYYLFKHEKAVRSIIHSELKTECSA